MLRNIKSRDGGKRRKDKRRREREKWKAGNGKKCAGNERDEIGMRVV